MAKASDNVFPKVIVSEGSTPAAAASGQQKLFIDSADHKLKRINSGGTVTTVEGGGSSGSSYPLGSPDAPPGSPNAKDDEFDGTSTVTWTTTPTAPNASDINTTAPGSLYLKASGSGAALVGKYQAVPASYPYTIATKVFSTGRANYHKAGGIFLVGSAPTNTSQALILSHTARSSGAAAGVQRTLITLGGTFTSEGSIVLPEVYGPAKGPRYLRLKVNSATSVDCYASADGKAWLLVENINPGFTPAFMGLACSEENTGGGVEAYFEFFRVT